MKLKKQFNKLLVFVLMILISIFLALAILGYIYNLFPKLSNFEIIKIKEEKTGLFLYTTKCYNAISYNVAAFDEHDNIIFEKTGTNNKIDISDLILDYNSKVTFKVTTKNIKNEVKKAKNEFEYTNRQASFSKIKNHFINDKSDIVLYLLGNEENKKYTVNLFYKGSKIFKQELTDNTITIKYDDVKSYEGRITAKLFNENNRVISIFNIYLNTPIVGNLNIISPENNYTTDWDDIIVRYEGGINATNLTVKVYTKKNKLINTIKQPFKDNQVTIPASWFSENTSYRIELIASYSDYMEISKSQNIYVNILEKQTVKPVYVNKNFNFVKSGTPITLKSDTVNATIYYTTDGTKPNRNSMVYKNPITINNNMTIKTYAVKDNMVDSDINTYDFKIKNKDLVVYLSPSNQYSNKGVKSAGYTNERDMMNKLTDYLEKDLKQAGVKVYRNKPSGNINLWLAESNAKKSDLHLAIHSNGSVNHDTNGMEIYVDKQTSQCLSIASNIYNNLYEIYPYRDSISDRGVKYADGSLGEANDNFIKCGTLIEIAYHDNYNDALWIMQNMDSIAQNIADSILEFYQIKE